MSEEVSSSAPSHRELYPRMCVPWRQGNTRQSLTAGCSAGVWMGDWLCGRRRRIERMVTPQVWVNPGDWLPSEGPSLSWRKNSTACQLKWKCVYWKADTLSKSRVQASLKGENAPRVWGWLVFMGSVISYSSEWEEYFIIWGKGRIFRNWGRTHFCSLWSSLELSWHWHEGEWVLVL